ncbi:hypothetical protein OG21DRAFT_1491276 [Imleria badia]|nr:hypothetical protein OG21DRAFT_1491276 [Imleria badia]
MGSQFGYHGFEDGISKLKQVTGRDHHSIQCYIIGLIAGAVPRQFLVTICALIDFRYRTQAPIHSDQSLAQLAEVLQLFHDNKHSIVLASVRDSWEIPKLELLQSVASSIQSLGPMMQWSTNATEHAHVQEIKIPARLSNNQNYYEQIARYLDWSDKCFHFDVATHIETCDQQIPSPDNEDLDSDWEDVESTPMPPRCLNT